MNKMISYLFWLCVPILFFASLLPKAGFDPAFFFPTGEEFIRYDTLFIWLLNAIYFFVLGWVFKKIKIENYSLSSFGLFTILASFLFYNSMIDDEMIHEAIEIGHASADIFTTRTKLFYVGSSIWLVAQIIFWFKVTIHFFNQDEIKLELLDDAKF